MAVLSFKGTRLHIPFERLIPIFLRSPLPFTVRPPFHFPVPVIHHRLGVAMVATGGYMLAADPRIKCMIGPLDF